MPPVEIGMNTLRTNLRRLLGYVLGVALFLLAFGLNTSSPWVSDHYPYLAYFIASLLSCYIVGLGPANMVAVFSAVAAYFTFRSSGMFVSTAHNPISAGGAVLFLLLICNWMLGSLKLSRDRLAVERERYARLAESREVLYRELQHRVSNNIQIISGLLMLQGQAVGDTEAKRALNEASARIGLIARIQRQLHDQTGEPTPFRRFAEELLTDAIAASGVPGVKVEIEGGEDPLHEDQATPVSLVLLECVNNALEHGYASGLGGVVRVNLTKAEGRMLLSIIDDGKGLPEDFDTQVGKSLGLKIVRTMAAQLNGVFSIASAASGAVCRLEFPLLNAG
jgi:two-component sensor histidine kinase